MVYLVVMDENGGCRKGVELGVTQGKKAGDAKRLEVWNVSACLLYHGSETLMW